MDDWEEQSWFGRQPAREIVMIQCAGSRDRRRLPYCSRLCCMIALKHAIRLRALFPEMKVTICYLELRAAGWATRTGTWRRAGPAWSSCAARRPTCSSTIAAVP